MGNMGANQNHIRVFESLDDFALSDEFGVIVDRAILGMCHKSGGDGVDIMWHNGTSDNEMFVFWFEFVYFFKKI